MPSPGNRYFIETCSSPGGVFADQIETVSIRPAWSPFAEEVYFGNDKPQLRWLNEQTLEITYPQPPTWKYKCGGSWAGIKVVCEIIPKK
jgi:hypothetical protein